MLDQRRAIARRAFINTTISDMRLYHRYSTFLIAGKAHIDLERISAEILESGITTFPLPLQVDHLYLPLSPAQLFASEQGPSQMESFLLEYYRSVVCHDPRHIPPDDDNKHPLEHILTMGISSRAIYPGLMMITANFLQSDNAAYRIVALEYRQRVLKIVCELLGSDGDLSEEVIMLAAMLCSSEVSVIIDLRMLRVCTSLC